MRNLLLLLLLANVLYFMWGKFVASPDSTGVALVTESKLGPKLQLADAKSIETAVENAEQTVVARPSEIEAHFGRSCVTIGPLRESSEADGALADIEDEGLQGTVRATQGEVFVGHWVQVRDIPDRATANEMLRKLQDGGLGEAYIVETPEEGVKISLGLFGDLSGAERIELQAKSMDLPAEITNRMRNATVFYVDIGLPPGRGATTLIERYGEDRVLLRDAATCPRSD
ncbi:SPOR domain-containing protein [Woeseia oceani]|uniref:SPOR domain-containing protein n=1 Tax=Woeseia oceani TaxID=1548547 RepID=A0A193LD76_9GAMM|nr:SPOR domain-containing protein [Woeseia oceani]ANO50433.1 hypothetical protein BA177_03715 [Woeseia oceani]